MSISGDIRTFKDNDNVYKRNRAPVYFNNSLPRSNKQDFVNEKPDRRENNTAFLRYFVLKPHVMKRLLLIPVFACLLAVSEAHAQVPEFDKLEMLYAQGHYKMVYRRANRLLDKPDYDFSKIPLFYKSLSLFQLAENSHWFKRHTDAYKEAAALFTKIKQSPDGLKIFNAHLYEVSILKQDLFSRAEDLKRRGERQEFEALQEVLTDLFENVPNIDLQGEVKQDELAEYKEKEKVKTIYASERDEMIAFAMKQLGVPYVWAGNTPNGFDCSGFTCYVMNEFKRELPRRASDQYDGARKVRQNKVQKGDLVFFNNGRGISHVGIIISEAGEPLVMIHASSSKGIIITEIEKSDYWLKRLSGFGTYVD